MRLMRCGLAAALLLLPSSVTYARVDLSFRDRVECQRAVEAVYYAHRLATTKSFEEAVPESVLEEKVRRQLLESVALRDLWKRPVTAEMLRAEMARIAKQTRLPSRLEEVYDALGRDPLLVQECLARPALVDRLARSYFTADERIHRDSRRGIEALRKRLLDGSLDPRAEHPLRTEESPPGADASPPGTPGQALRPVRTWGEPEKEALDRWRARFPAVVGEIGPVVDAGDALEIRVVLAEDGENVRAATYRVPKLSWDAWWARRAGDFDADRAHAVAESMEKLPAASGMEGAQTCLPDDLWTPQLTDIPEGRSSYAAVWTGSHMIVWGGNSSSVGSLYDPLTNSWTSTSAAGAPTARYYASSVWTGTEMLVWGGVELSTYNWVQDGGRYDPSTDSWASMSTAGAPPGRRRAAAVWTGNRMIVWGGSWVDIMTWQTYYVGSGGVYDPAADTWSAMTGAGAPAARDYHSAVWTGGEFIVWGGEDGTGVFGDGARYDPGADTWTSVTATDAPSPRSQHSMTWTGSRLVVFGGWDGTVALDTGGRYDPAGDVWTTTSTAGAPAARRGHSATWTGTGMIVWGGTLATGVTDTGARYDPSTDTWIAATSTVSAPPARSFHSAVWTGTEMIVWGVEASGTGGRYDPATDTWVPTLSGLIPIFRLYNSTVWTGSEMIVWGGSSNPYASGAPEYDTGGRYDPLLSGWTPTSTTNAPAARLGHSAVWTGSEMIVWGGSDKYDADVAVVFGDGGRYDPVADTWSGMTTAGAPSARFLQKAVWTGAEMVVWGGTLDLCNDLDTGGRYDPASDTWSPISTSGAPLPSYEATAVWTGTEMIVWGGRSWTGCSGTSLPAGARYNPTSDTWTAMSASQQPERREEHTAVWTGDSMIVWGGQTPSNWRGDDSGGRYDPATDTWASTSLTGTPGGRTLHSAVWTGKEMIVWSGQRCIGTSTSCSYTPIGGGGRYDPGTDSWLPLSTVEEPPPMARHAAVWAGGEMLVWGGDTSSGRLGGRYSLGGGTDDDLDGFTECGGDCDDANPLAYPGQSEVCDGFDTDCDGSKPADDVDEDADGVPVCAADCDDTDPRVYPGAAQVCDGINNDCLDAGWPATAGTNESDDDSDGVSECGGDCDDADPQAILDPAPISGLATVLIPGGARFEWDSQALPPGSPPAYDVFRGSAAALAGSAGDYSTGACSFEDLADPFVEILGGDPPPDGIFYYLFRAQNLCGTGTWGTAAEDAGAAASASPCL